jgi:hypothetical protein
MTTNLDRYRKDLDRLLKTGALLLDALHYLCRPEETEESIKKHYADKTKDYLKALPQRGAEGS